MTDPIDTRGWRATTLGEIGDYINGRGFKKSEWSDRGRMIIRIQDLTGTGRAPNYFRGDCDEKHVVRDGDLLISWAATLDAFVWHGPEAVLNQHIFKVASRIDPRFHYYLVKSVLGDIRSRAHGSGMVHVTKGEFERTSVLVPDETVEQVRVADLVEQQLSRLAAAMSFLEAARRRSQFYVDRLLDRTFTGRGLERLPSGWRWAPLSELVADDPQNGLYLPKSQYGSGTAILRIDDFQDDFSRPATDMMRVEADPPLLDRYRLDLGDLVINRVNSPSHLGKSLVVESRHTPAVFESNMMRLRLSEALEPWFAHFYLGSPTGRRRLTRGAKWAVNQASINQRDVLATEVPLPPSVERQREIVDDLQEQLSTTRELRQTILRAKELSRSLERAILDGLLGRRLDRGTR